MKGNASCWLRLAALAVFAVLTVAVTAPARARALDLEQQLALPKLETVQATAGMRTTLIRSAGFDPFSRSDALPQLSLALAHPFAQQGAFAVSAGIGMDYGEASATARSTPATLSIWRLSAIAEGRYYLWPFAYAFARFAPGMLRGGAILADASSPTGGQLEDHFDVLGADASLGAAIRISGPANPVAVWACAEGGYGFAQGHRLLLAPPAPARDQPRLAPVDLGRIDPRGAFLRFTLALTY
jgi:hypothetical protein